MQKRLTQLLLVLTLLVPAVAFADHNWTRHRLEISAVGAGRNLWWYDNTPYYVAVGHASGTWNALGRVSVHQGSAYSGAHMTWESYSSSSDGLCGSSNSYTAKIWLNSWWFNQQGDWNRKSCAAHELGHQLQIGDHGAGYSGALMYGHVGRFISPQQHDRDDYYNNWP